MNDPLADLLKQAWQHLGRGVADRQHPARHPTLATMGPEGVEMRTVVLRAARPGASQLEFHTDALSPKCAQITADPRVAIHVWLPGPRLQLRIRAVARLAPGDPAVFASLPPQAAVNYGGPVPGAPLQDGAGPDGAEGAGDAARFTRILCDLEDIDILHLGDPQRRARFHSADGWRGGWIAP